MADISINASGLDTLSRALERFPDIAAKALPPAINRTLSTVNTKLQKEITTKYKIKKSDLNGGGKYKSEKSNNLIKIKKATSHSMDGRIDVRGSTLNLSRFLMGNKSPVSHKGKTKKQILKIKFPKVQVMKGSSKIVKGAFIQNAKNATGIFNRNQNGKLRMLRTLSIAQMAGNKEILKVAEETAIETLEKRIEHEMEYRMNRMAGEVNGNS